MKLIIGRKPLLRGAKLELLINLTLQLLTQHNGETLWPRQKNIRTKKGIDAPTIMAKTGFNQKKVWAIVLRAYKAGKIKRVAWYLQKRSDICIFTILHIISIYLEFCIIADLGKIPALLPWEKHPLKGTQLLKKFKEILTIII